MKYVLYVDVEFPNMVVRDYVLYKKTDTVVTTVDKKKAKKFKSASQAMEYNPDGKYSIEEA